MFVVAVVAVIPAGIIVAAAAVVVELAGIATFVVSKPDQQEE